MTFIYDEFSKKILNIGEVFKKSITFKKDSFFKNIDSFEQNHFYHLKTLHKQFKVLIERFKKEETSYLKKREEYFNFVENKNLKTMFEFKNFARTKNKQFKKLKNKEWEYFLKVLKINTFVKSIDQNFNFLMNTYEENIQTKLSLFYFKLLVDEQNVNR